MAKQPKPTASESRESATRIKISQADVPNLNISQALKIIEALWENFAGKPAAPHQVAMALDLSPTSGGWRNLCGASIAYGLTEGGYNAATISLTSLGRRIVAPTVEGDDKAALREASLKPRIPREFFNRYNRAKFPREDIAENIIIQMGIPKDRAKSVVAILRDNGRKVGIIQETKTGLFVADVHQSTVQPTWNEGEFPEGKEVDQEVDDAVIGTPVFASSETPHNNKVFITHGRNLRVLEQIKKLVALGGFDPVISVQTETAAKPVPDKVMDDMRMCSAAVIHVGSDGIVTDADGVAHTQINPNVLIEIGAAMALYKRRYILVVENGVKLPSNLQGLYESRYNGDAIELDAGMKILEALRGLKGS